MSDDALVNELRELARVRLATVEALVASALEEDEPSAPLRELARELHTLKGEARIVGLAALAARVHEAEDAAAELARDLASPERRRALHEALDVVAATLEAPLDAAARAASERPGERTRVAPWRLDRLVDLATTVRSGASGRESLLAEVELLRAELRAIRRQVTTSPDPRALQLALDRADRRAAQIASRAREAAGDAREHADELEDAARALALVPLSALFAPQRGALRRMAAEQGKDVALDVEGADVEVDPEILDGLAVPLVHLLRNAIDHGIELPSERVAAGKPAAGRVTLRARTEGSAIVLHVEDDGRGVDVDAVRARALEMGALEGASQADVLRAAMTAGLSTRVVGDTSGRGVGLDAVASGVAALGGSVELQSEKGRGTRVLLRLPGSRLVSRGAVIETGGHAWALPASAVRALLDASDAEIVRAGSGWVLRREDRALGYATLGSVLGVPTSRAPACVLVIGEGDRELALGVDRCRGVERVSVRRDTALVGDLPLLDGAAVRQDGEAVPMLDVGALLRLDLSRLGAGERRGAIVTRRSVLVVDDSELMRDVAASALRAMGHEVREAVDGRDALRCIAERPADLVVSDLDMPVMDGFALLEALRADPASARVPIVVFTASDGDAAMRRAGELGADAYVVKSRMCREELERAVLGLLARGEPGAPASERPTVAP